MSLHETKAIVEAGKIFLPAAGQIVDYRHPGSQLMQSMAEGRANKARPPGDANGATAIERFVIRLTG